MAELNTLIVYAPLAPALVEQLKARFTTVLVYPILPFRPIAPNTVLPSDADLARADVIFGFTFPASLRSWDQVPRLKLFAGMSAGTSHLTETALFKSLPEFRGDITFTSASGIHVCTIGEHVIATTLMLLHRLHEQVLMQHQRKKWVDVITEFGPGYTRELRGMTVGILGYGHIGRETARLAHAFGSKIVALTRSGKPATIGGYILPDTGDIDGTLPVAYYSTQSPASTLGFFSACDVVVSTLPSLPETKKLVGAPQFKAMRGNAIFVNIGRGDTVDTEALVSALQAKPAEGESSCATGTLRIGGASLDVTDPEPLPDDHALFSLENAIITPHTSGYSATYFHRAVDLLEQNVDRLRQDKGALNAYRGKLE